MAYDREPAAGFSDHWFTSFDGARLGLDVYLPHSAAPGRALAMPARASTSKHKPQPARPQPASMAHSRMS